MLYLKQLTLDLYTPLYYALYVIPNPWLLSKNEKKKKPQQTKEKPSRFCGFLAGCISLGTIS